VAGGKNIRVQVTQKERLWLTDVPTNAQGVPCDFIIQNQEAAYGVSLGSGDGEKDLILAQAKSTIKCDLLSVQDATKCEVNAHVVNKIDLEYSLGVWAKEDAGARAGKRRRDDGSDDPGPAGDDDSSGGLPVKRRRQ
jgi:hypothetical protein